MKLPSPPSRFFILWIDAVVIYYYHSRGKMFVHINPVIHTNDVLHRTMPWLYLPRHTRPLTLSCSQSTLQGTSSLSVLMRDLYWSECLAFCSSVVWIFHLVLPVRSLSFDNNNSNREFTERFQRLEALCDLKKLAMYKYPYTNQCICTHS